jgi:ElaB/YqjD/DUF883 family membrane-anchored ribosome-binding protein
MTGYGLFAPCQRGVDTRPRRGGCLILGLNERGKEILTERIAVCAVPHLVAEGKIMADTPKTEVTSVESVQKSVEKQISELRKEIAKINKSLSERSAELASEARDVANDAIEEASTRASRAAQQLRTQAQSVSETARENPAATGIVVGLAGLVGVVIGFAIAKGSGDQRNGWY